MATVADLQTSVTNFRETISESMSDFISTTKQRLSDFFSSVDDTRTFELDYINSSISELVVELDDYKQKADSNKLAIELPLDTDEFDKTIPLSTLTKYAPIYKDITDKTSDIVNTLLPVINLPTTESTIKNLIANQSYTTKYLACFDAIVEACLNHTSDIGSPTDLFVSILYLENERNLYIARLAMMQEDAKVGAKGFRRPNSTSVFNRTEVLDKYNRELLGKYKEALAKVNNQLASLYNKALDILLNKESFSVSMSGKLLDSLVDASKLNTEFAIEEVKIAFLEYSSDASAAIKKLESEIKNIKTKEEAFIKASQMLFDVQADSALKSFDALKKKVDAEISLAIKDSDLGAEEIKLRVEAGVKELNFITNRLDTWASTMAQQSNDKAQSIAQANAVYQKTLSTLGSNAIALSTTK